MGDTDHDMSDRRVEDPTEPGRPELGGGLGPLGDALTYLAEGDFCRAYLLGDDRVVRVAKHDEATGSLRREACLLARVAPELPVAVPKPRFVPAAEAGGPAFSVHDLVSGREMTREVWRGWVAADRARVAEELGRVLGALHRIDAAVGRSCGLTTLDHAVHVEGLRARMAGEVGRALPDALHHRLDAAFGSYLAGGEAWAYEPAILHADVSPAHVLVEEGPRGAGPADPSGRPRLSGLIDWGDALVGDPARDFIFLYEDWSADFLEAVLGGYDPEPAERLLPRVYMHYLADQLEWTLDAAEEGRGEDVGHGVRMLATGADVR